MRKLSVCALLVVGALAWSPVVSVANADSFALAEATLDWTGFSFRVSDGLTIDSVVYSYLGSTASAETRHGTGQTILGTRSSSANSHYSNALGEATSTSGIVNGALSSHSEAASFEEPTIDSAGAGAFASTSFWLYGSGAGVLTVEVPYELHIEATAGPGATVGATALVSLELGPGTGWFASDSLTWDLSSPFMTRKGTLLLSREFVEPTWGPLVFIGAGASTEAITAVPEPSTMALLALGGLSAVSLRRRATRRARSQRLD
jgi:hypothetical protein